MSVKDYQERGVSGQGDVVLVVSIQNGAGQVRIGGLRGTVWSSLEYELTTEEGSTMLWLSLNIHPWAVTSFLPPLATTRAVLCRLLLICLNEWIVVLYAPLDK